MKTKSKKTKATKAKVTKAKAKTEEMKKYFTFIENNDWEGETWKFYIQDQYLKQVKDLYNYWVKCEKAKPWGWNSNQYILETNLLPEGEVDILVKHSHSCYMAFHNKVTGIIDNKKMKMFKKDIDSELKNALKASKKGTSCYSGSDPFYKGGIQDLFTEEQK